MKEKQNKEQYDLAILRTIEKENHRLNDDSNIVYYGFDYLKTLLEDMKAKGKGEKIIKKFTKELQPEENGKFKICSVASSARFTYLNFHDNCDIEYEADLPIKLDHKKSPSAHPDAFSEKEKIYYECKCHEIFDSHASEKLSKRYKDVVDSYFGIKSIIDGDTLLITQKQLDIGGDTSIYKMHFNVKQLLCHLMGIAENKKEEPAELKYIFFVPDNAKSFSVIEELEEEVQKIKSSKVIRKMCSNNNIKLDSFEFKNVREIPDPIYKKLEEGKHNI